VRPCAAADKGSEPSNRTHASSSAAKSVAAWRRRGSAGALFKQGVKETVVVT